MAAIEFTRRLPGDPTAIREFVTFSTEPVANPGKSEQAGRPIFDTVEHISIRFPGNNLTEIVREVTEADRQKYADQYAAFKKGAGTVVEGTPLEAWTALSKAQVREFQALNIFSVEQLSAVDDYFIQRMGIGGRMWRDRAKIFLEASEDTAAIDRVASENGRLKEQIEGQNRQIIELGSIIERLSGQVQALQVAQVNQQGPAVPQIGAIAAPSFPLPSAPVGGSIEATSDYVAPRRPGRPKKAEAA